MCSIPPVLCVQSGDIITFDCLDASNGQITPDSTSDSLRTLDFSRLNQVNGPVYVELAEPGDVLQIDVLFIVPSVSWGWSATIPGFGLLADDFREPSLKLWRLQNYENGAGYAWFDEEKGIRIPLRPFAGEMGIARAAPGAHSTIPPYVTGGNIDTRHVTAGSTLYLPVEVAGALFSMGVRLFAETSERFTLTRTHILRMGMLHRVTEVRPYSHTHVFTNFADYLTPCSEVCGM